MTEKRDLARQTWQTLSSKTVHETPFLRLREDRVKLPNDREISYGVVECGECVGVLPFVDAERVVLVRQYRYVAGRFTWEMPTGGVHEGESKESAAQRECAEEAGYRATKLKHLCTYHTSKSSLDETAHLFVGEDLIAEQATGDDTEFTETKVLPFREVLSMVLEGEITDSMTIIAVLMAARVRDTQP